MIGLVSQFGMVSFIPIDMREESSIQSVLSQVDACIQYGEDADMKIKDIEFDFDAEGAN